MTIIDVYNELRKQLLPIGLNVHKAFKPENDTANCIVINSIPIKKNNYNSIFDIVITLYLKKINSEFDGVSANRIYPLISNGITGFINSGHNIAVTERLDPHTINLNDSYTTTEFIFKTIIF